MFEIDRTCSIRKNEPRKTAPGDRRREQRFGDAPIAAELAQPEMLVDELFLLLEGARVTAQTIGREGLGDRLIRMGEAMIAAHDK
jgi:hypothetical protein